MGATEADRFPPPPAGYQPAVLFQYPKIKLQVAALFVLATITPLLILVAVALHRQLAWESFIRWDDGIYLLSVVVTVILTAIVHELVHGVAYQLLGYQVTYGVSGHLLAAYAAAFGQWQTRDHNMITALAPLVVLTGGFIPLLAIGSRVMVLVAVAALMMNTAGATGDMYLAWRLMRMPRATLLYDVDVKTMLIYLPDDGEGEDLA